MNPPDLSALFAAYEADPSEENRLAFVSALTRVATLRTLCHLGPDTQAQAEAFLSSLGARIASDQDDFASRAEREDRKAATAAEAQIDRIERLARYIQDWED